MVKLCIYLQWFFVRRVTREWVILKLIFHTASVSKISETE